MSEKKRAPRRPKVKRLADGSISIDGFIAPPPRMPPPAQAQREPMYSPTSRVNWSPARLEYVKPKPCYSWALDELQEEVERDVRRFFARAPDKGGKE